MVLYVILSIELLLMIISMAAASIIGATGYNREDSYESAKGVVLGVFILNLLVAISVVASENGEPPAIGVSTTPEALAVIMVTALINGVWGIASMRAYSYFDDRAYRRAEHRRRIANTNRDNRRDWAWKMASGYLIVEVNEDEDE